MRMHHKSFLSASLLAGEGTTFLSVSEMFLFPPLSFLFLCNVFSHEVFSDLTGDSLPPLLGGSFADVYDCRVYVHLKDWHSILRYHRGRDFYVFNATLFFFSAFVFLSSPPSSQKTPSLSFLSTKLSLHLKK
ncbi:hypothetical protein CSUI_005896 [Cystoisospora suis]|uniref:Transmembrane protein n=1 Tax=Cystoisospora suis TaxID=483139 RepID=A0A2C6KWC0_9APIC|nr:hypothetical protein CSUI_005896 [Cystoisospora suis]